MEITVNYAAILVCGVVAMVVGAVWYGPIFGKKWMEIMKVNSADMEARKKMQKEAGPLYAVQFVLSLFQAYVLAHYIAGWEDASGVENAVWVWAAFVMPTVAGSSMWNNNPGRVKWTMFLIQAGYQLAIFILFGLILGMWR